MRIIEVTPAWVAVGIVEADALDGPMHDITDARRLLSPNNPVDICIAVEHARKIAQQRGAANIYIIRHAYREGDARLRSPSVR